MPGKTPHGNGKEPVENGGIRNSKEVEEAALKSKKKAVASKDGDEEMTVVVPPSKATSSKQGAPDGTDGDVAMAEDGAEDEVVKADPAVQASAGVWFQAVFNELPQSPPWQP